MIQQTPTIIDDSNDHDLIPDELQEKSQPQAPVAKKPVGRDWAPIDLSKGSIRKGIFGSRQSFKTHVRKDLRSGLGSILNASQREEVASSLANLRQHGLGPGEVKKKLEEMRKAGKLTKFEARKLRRQLKVKKSSFF